MLTKLDMAKVVVTALYNLDSLVTDKQTVLWKEVLRRSRWPKTTLEDHYHRAMNAINSRIS